MKVENIFLFLKDDYLSGRGFFHGYAFDDKSILFGQSGYEEFIKINKDINLEELEGRFCGLFRQDDFSIIKTDKTGQELLYFYEKDNDWAVSNSLIYLLKYASSKTSLGLYRPTVLGFHLRNGTHIGEQMISHRTMVENINLVPISAQIVIDNKGNARVDKKEFKDIFESKLDDYYDRVIQFLEKGSGLLQALMKLDRSVNLSLSGGYDSRIVLAMLLNGDSRNPSFLNKLNISSHTNMENDFRVASRLAAMHGINLNQFKSPSVFPRISSSDSLKFYFLSAGGAYLPIYPVSNLGLGKNFFINLTGDEPVGRDYYIGNERFKGTARKVGDDVFNFFKQRGELESAELVQKEFLEQFDILGVDIDSPNSMISFYTALRSRLHGGRNSYKSLGNSFLFTTLIQSDLVSLSLHNLANGEHPNKIYVDIFSAFGGWALNEKFEKPSRDFTQELIEKSPFKGGVKITPRSYDIYGTPYEHRNGRDVFDMFDLNLDVGVQPEEIKNLLEKLFYRATDLKKYPDLFSSFDWQLAKKEVTERGSLSHGYRKLTHIVTTDLILRMINT